MSLIGNIAGIPLFTTIQEAEAWALASGLSGYHTHNLQGIQGYMGGINHQQATGMPMNTNEPVSQPSSVPPGSNNNTNPTPTSAAPSSSGGGGGY